MSARMARMHTAEHILTAIMKKEYGAERNIELHLGDKKTKCDYAPSKPLRDDDIREIEALVNREIQNNHAVSFYYLDRPNANSRFDLWKVPADLSEIRIVCIGEFDAQPCRGTHVSDTGDIGTFNIQSYEQRDNGNMRIRFRVLDTPPA